MKGGGLAAAARCEVVTFALSDVVGPVRDDPGVIGSGPTAPDTSTWEDALSVVTRRGVLARLPQAVRLRLEAGARGELPETPKPGDPRLARAAWHLIGSRGGSWHLLTAGAFITMIVPLLVFLLLQRAFVRGILAGSVKS